MLEGYERVVPNDDSSVECAFRFILQFTVFKCANFGQVAPVKRQNMKLNLSVIF